MSWFKYTYQCRELDGIHGEPLEYDWKMRISVKESLLHFRISDKSVFQCWSTFGYFKHCKIQPIVNLLLILEPRSWPITEWWHFRSNSTSSCPLICWFRAMCTKQRFGLSTGILCWKNWEIIKIVFIVTNHQQCSATTLWIWICFFLWTVRYENTVHTRQEPTETVKILSLLDRYCQQVRKMVITRIVSTNYLFRHCTHTWMKSHCVQTDMLAPNLGLEPVRLLSQNGHEDIRSECANRFMRVAWTGSMTVSLNTHSIRTSGRNCKYSQLHMRYIQSLTSLKPRETRAHRTQDVTAPSTPTTTPRRVGSLPQGHPGLWSTPVDPARTPTVHRCLYGGRPWVARHKLNCFASNIRVRYLWSPFRSQSSSRDAAEIWVVISEPCTFSCRLMLKVAPLGEWAGWTQPSSRGATSQKKEEHPRALLKPAASQVAQEERRAANRAVKVFALQRGFALDDYRESTPTLVHGRASSLETHTESASGHCWASGAIKYFGVRQLQITPYVFHRGDTGENSVFRIQKQRKVHNYQKLR